MLSKYVDYFDKNMPLKEYPRPQLVRKSYQSLNGQWDFVITSTNDLPDNYNREIIVPYCVESYLSGICETIEENNYLFYRKQLVLNKDVMKDKILLHFDAVDQFCQVYVNNILVISNDNGYLPFVVDIKPYLNKTNNEIIVCVKDELSHDFLYGKQSKNRGGCWYTPVSGIWQSVWIEGVSEDYISQLTITPNIDENSVRIIAQSTAKNFSLIIKEKDKIIYKQSSKNPLFDVKIDNPILWSPENPFLYDIIIETPHDSVNSYFAMRKFSTNEKYFLLNNKPYFLHGLLDQGFFPDGIYTPASYKAFEDDILTMKKLGFNCLRKHIKIEPMMYYHYCDKYGMIVLQDMVNNGSYSFFIDTALPFIGLKKFALHLKNHSEVQKDNFKKALVDTLNYFYNTPCIGYYTIFNEGWGQHEADMYYHLTKEIDSSRVVDSTSGWFKETDSDVESLHIYIHKIKINKNKLDKPIILSEFGGYAYKVEKHVYNDDQFGYKKFKNLKSYNEALYKLYKDEIVKNIKNGLAGCIYTQVSDVEDEINGLLTYDRKVLKVDVDILIQIKKEIDEEFYNE